MLYAISVECLRSFKPLLTLFACSPLCAEQEDEEASTGSHLKLIVDAFIQQLPNCVNRDLIDKVTIRAPISFNYGLCCGSSLILNDITSGTSFKSKTFQMFPNERKH